VTSWPIKGQGKLIDMNANSGAIHIGDKIKVRWPGRRARSRITDNRVKVVSKSGAGATNGIAVYDFSDNPREVTIADTVISNNRSRSANTGRPSCMAAAS
jgi:hypothetical protein